MQVNAHDKAIDYAAELERLPLASTLFDNVARDAVLCDETSPIGALMELDALTLFGKRPPRVTILCDGADLCAFREMYIVTRYHIRNVLRKHDIECEQAPGARTKPASVPRRRAPSH